MKIVYIVLSVIAVAFIAVQIFALKSQKNIETYPYVVNEKYDQFEIRHYEVTLFKEDSLMLLMTNISLSLILVIMVQNDLLSQNGSVFSLHLDLDGMYRMKNLWSRFQMPLRS